MGPHQVTQLLLKERQAEGPADPFANGQDRHEPQVPKQPPGYASPRYAQATGFWEILLALMVTRNMSFSAQDCPRSRGPFTSS